MEKLLSPVEEKRTKTTHTPVGKMPLDTEKLGEGEKQSWKKP